MLAEGEPRLEKPRHGGRPDLVQASPLPHRERRVGPVGVHRTAPECERVGQLPGDHLGVLRPEAGTATGHQVGEQVGVDGLTRQGQHVPVAAASHVATR